MRCVEVLVREDPPLSRTIEERTGVRHESPQVICLAGGRAVGQVSHYEVTVAGLKQMVSSK